jgi:frataxin-like iron-binding protein CyaY
MFKKCSQSWITLQIGLSFLDLIRNAEKEKAGKSMSCDGFQENLV